MKAKWAFFFACLAACEIGVDIGSRGATVAFDAGVEDLFCAEPSQLVAFEVRLDAMPLTDPTCFIDGVVPPAHTLPEETFTVLIATSATTSLGAGGAGGGGGGAGGGAGSSPNITQQLTLAIDGLQPQRLGDAPLIEVGAAMDGFEWTRTHTTRVRRLYQELRRTSARFEFDRLDLSQTAGQLVLSSSWSCSPRGSACTWPGDRQSCSVIRPFVARRLPEVPAPWLTPTTERVEGAEAYLVTVDLGALSRGMTCSPVDATDETDSTPNLRALEIWQFTPSLIRLPPRSVAFPVAPVLELESDFPRDAQTHGSQLRARDRVLAPEAIERAFTSASMFGRRCGAWAGDGGLFVRSAELVLESRAECIGTGCTSAQSPEGGTCRAVVPWLPMKLP